MTRDARNQNATSALVFIHIPKAAGSTLSDILSRQYPRDARMNIGFSQPKEHDRFLELSPEERGRLLCISGHLPYGIQDSLPQPTRLITVLRHPVARFVSEFKHLLGRGSENRTFPPDAISSLEAFLDYRIRTHTLNLQTAQISGYLPAGRFEGTVLEQMPADALDCALNNLDEFAVVGLQERFDESIYLMKRRLGWSKSVVFPRQNTARKVAVKTDVTPELERRILEAAREDLALYQAAAERFERDVRDEGPDFAAGVQKLRKANHLIYRIQKAYVNLVPKKVRNLSRKVYRKLK